MEKEALLKSKKAEEQRLVVEKAEAEKEATRLALAEAVRLAAE